MREVIERTRRSSRGGLPRISGWKTDSVDESIQYTRQIAKLTAFWNGNDFGKKKGPGKIQDPSNSSVVILKTQANCSRNLRRHPYLDDQHLERLLPLSFGRSYVRIRLFFRQLRFPQRRSTFGTAQRIRVRW